ncbi:hypothetical protein Hanom_Chr13g01232071 [Helianthus anomalus]
MFFRIDFMLLFLTIMATSRMNGYVNDKILKRLTFDTQFEEYDWCGYIVECLRKCKKKWKPKDPNSCWAGPLTILMVCCNFVLVIYGKRSRWLTKYFWL